MKAFLRIVAIGVSAVLGLYAQGDGQTVTLSAGAPPIGYTQVQNYTSGNLSSVCLSPSSIKGPIGARRLRTNVSISAATNANPVVFTSTGHGFPINSRPLIAITGATGNWTPVNATANANGTVYQTATVIDANTFSIPVDSTTFGALTGTLTFVTTAARTTVAEWAVKELAYDISNNLIWVGWLNGSSGYDSKCSDAGSTTINRQ